MHIWIVSWVDGSNPVNEVFTDIEQAMQCIRYMAENKSGLSVKHLEIQRSEENAGSPEAEAAEPAEPVETPIEG